MTKESEKKMKKVGERVRQARKQRGLSQTQLAEAAQVSPSHISDLENGKKTIGLDIFMRITEALQVSADSILQTNVPEVMVTFKAEYSEVLDDCNPEEARFLIDLSRYLKKNIREFLN
jgi:transcriptional regulator with XRE-family HTH domain